MLWRGILLHPCSIVSKSRAETQDLPVLPTGLLTTDTSNTAPLLYFIVFGHKVFILLHTHLIIIFLPPGDPLLLTHTHPPAVSPLSPLPHWGPLEARESGKAGASLFYLPNIFRLDGPFHPEAVAHCVSRDSFSHH